MKDGNESRKAVWKTLNLLYVLMFLIQGQMKSQVTVSGAVSGNGTYADLSSAFSAINASSQSAASITVDITASTNETTTAVLNAGTWANILVRPSGTAAIVSANLGAPLVSLNGAANVKIDGLNAGGNGLSLVNTSTGNANTSTLRFINGANNNTVTNCVIQGSSTSPTLGTISFTTSTGSGNSSNVISSCSITAAGSNFPTNAIYSAGTSTAINATNQILNNQISDYFDATNSSAGILVATNNSSWTISGNSLFQTAMRTYTASATHYGISVTSGTNQVITGNVIGYANAAGTGLTALSSTAAVKYNAINLSSATTGTASIQGNTISAISLTTSSSASGADGILCGINVTAGNANIGNVTPNIIGGTSGVDLFAGYPTASGGAVVGINASSTATVNIQSNYLGGLTSAAASPSLTGGVMGINISGATGRLAILSNTIGNITANNLRAGVALTTTVNSVFVGINFASAPSGTVNVNANIIRNAASYGIGSGGTLRGIYTTGTSGSTTFSITNNVIGNLTTDNANTATGNGQLGTVGVAITYGTTNRISNNTIFNISSTTTASTGVIVGGISTAVSSDPMIFSNTIYGLTNTGTSTTTTAPAMVFGIFIRGASNDVSIFNNMISLGTGQTANTSFIGICPFSGGGTPVMTRIYYNTINIDGNNTSGNMPSFGIYRGNFSSSAVTFPVDIRNNILTNNRTGGTGGHYAIANNYGATPSTTGWGTNASNYNVLSAASATQVGWWTTPLNFASWKTASSSDANSFSGITVTYVNSASDLHLNLGTVATVIESGATPISTITTDFDAQTRPGPAGSVNGGAAAPDIGADEFDGVPLDIVPPVIVHTPLLGACSTADRTLTATISDLFGVPVTGSVQPMVYFKKNSGTYISSQGSLTSGSGLNGVWTFTISSSAMSGLTSGDVVSYFIIAQDQATTANVSSLPAAGLVASGVNSITTFPTAPLAYTVQGSIGGTYTVGTGGTYLTLTAAANAYNNSCLTSSVTFVLTDALYSAAETLPITFMTNPSASSTFSLLVRPANGNAATVTGTNTSAASVLKFLNAKYITVDGINSGGSSLTLISPNTGTSADVWLASTAATGPGNNNIALKNLTAVAGSSVSGYGVIAGVDGASPAATGGLDNDNITVQGVTVYRALRAIFSIATTSTSVGGNDNWLITGNTIGASSSGTANIGESGIFMDGAVNATITANSIRNIVTASSSSIGGINVRSGTGISISQNSLSSLFCSASVSGVNSMNAISVGPSISSSTLSYNNISGVENTSTGGWGSRGIIVNTGQAAATNWVHNNMVSNIVSYSDPSASYWPIGIDIEGASGNLNVDFNSVNLFGNHTGLTSATGCAPVYINSSGTTIRLRNNILSNTYDNTSSSTDIAYGIYSNVANTIFSTINYNAYYVGGTASSLVLGYLGSNQTSISGIQTAFGGNLNSISASPTFSTNTDLHLQLVGGNIPFDNTGTTIAGIPLDIDLQTRNVSTPDIGADEITIPTCTSAVGGVLSSATGSACSGQTIAVSSAGASQGVTTSYQWQYALTAGGPYSVMPGGSGGTTTSYTSAPLSTGVYYVNLKVTCGAASLTATSNEGTLTVYGIPTATASTGNATICSGGSVTLSGGSNIGTSYFWNGPMGYTSTAQNPVLTNVPYFGGGVYTVRASANGCASPASSTSLTVLNGPSPVTVTPASTLICSGTSVTAVSSGGNMTSVFNFTNQTNQNSSTGYPAPYTAYYGGQKMQMYVLASELSAQGIVAGPLTAIQFPVVSLGSNWGSSITSLQNFQVSIKHTTNSSAGNNFETGLTVVAPATNFTPVVGYANTHVFSTPFIWDGVSNIVIETVFSNNFSGTSSDAVIQYNSSTSFASTIVYRADNTSFTTMAAATTSNATLSQVRPDFKLFGPGAAPLTWSPSSGLSSTTTKTVLAYPTSNTVYTVQASNSGCSASASMSVNVTASPTLQAVAASSVICAGGTTSLVASGAPTYTWNTSQQTATITVNPPSTTVYTVTSLVAPCPVASATTQVVVQPMPSLTIAPLTASICAQSVISLTASGAATYTWSGGQTTSVITVTPNSTTVYTVTSLMAPCPVVSATSQVVAYPLPVVSISPSSPTLCAQSVITLTASGALAYVWSNSVTAPTTSLSVQSNTMLYVAGADANGCMGMDSVAITTNSLPVVLIAQSANSVCANSAASFTASGASSYTWNTGATTAVLAITPSVTGVYTATGSLPTGCSSTQTVSIYAFTLPVVAISSLRDTMCTGETVTLTATGGVTYQWQPGAASGSANAVSPISATVYTVTGTDANQCANTAAFSLMVDPCTGIKGQSFTSQLSLFPNPTSGLVTASIPFTGEKTISVTNSAGQVVKTLQSNDTNIVVDLKENAKGIYFVRIEVQGQSANFRIVID